VRGFETGTISRDDWKHAEHLTVACYYAFHHDYKTAYDKMRGGIFNLLKAFGVDLSKEMPYHETITHFWMRTVSDLISSKNGYSIVELTNEVIKICADKDLPLKFYTRELLFSDRARTEFVEPDLKDFNSD
jgi:hypothetical protein